MPSRFAAGLLLAAGLSLGACASDDYGHGYGGLSVGYASAGYYDPYSDPWAGGGWGYYGSRPYWGWYDNYYYPGSGIYIYDRWRRPHRWSDRHRRYWTERRDYWRGRGDRTEA